MEVLYEPLLLTGHLIGLIATVIPPWHQRMMYQWIALDLGFQLVPYLHAVTACSLSYSVRSELVSLVVVLTVM